MTETNLDGTWTMIMGDEEADPGKNTTIIVAGGKAWDAETPDAVGTCSLVDGLMTITLKPLAVNGQTWIETITARLTDARSLSGNIHTHGPDGIDFSDPCVLLRGIDLYSKPKRAWTQTGDFIEARGTD